MKVYGESFCIVECVVHNDHGLGSDVEVAPFHICRVEDKVGILSVTDVVVSVLGCGEVDVIKASECSITYIFYCRGNNKLKLLEMLVEGPFGDTYYALGKSECICLTVICYISAVNVDIGIFNTTYVIYNGFAVRLTVENELGTVVVVGCHSGLEGSDVLGYVYAGKLGQIAECIGNNGSDACAEGDGLEYADLRYSALFDRGEAVTDYNVRYSMASGVVITVESSRREYALTEYSR